MKRMLLTFVCTVMAVNSAYADCDFAKDIQKQPDGSYSYTRDCHVEVGKKVNALDLREKQVLKLEETIQLKDLALDKAHERIDLWRETSYKIEDRANTMEEMKKKNETLYFILGVVVTGVAVWGAGQLK